MYFSVALGFPVHEFLPVVSYMWGILSILSMSVASLSSRIHTLLLTILFVCDPPQMLVSIIMLIPDSSSFMTLVDFFSFASWVFYGSTFAALLWLRWKRPSMHRPYKVSKTLS